MANTSINKTVIATLMITIIIDVMGMGLLFPILPMLFLDSNSPFLPITASSMMRHLYYGIGIAFWPVGAFFGAPYLGKLSDAIGRKKVLTFSLISNCIVYILTALSILFGFFSAFLMARLLSGFFAGSFEIAQATMVDISPPSLKTKYLGLMSLAYAGGLIFGPFVTGTTSFLGSFAFVLIITTPFWIAATLSAFNGMFISIVLKETNRRLIQTQFHISDIITSWSFIFSDRRVRKLGTIFFLLQIGWGIYFQGMPLILKQSYGYGHSLIATFFICLGISFTLSITLLQPAVLKYLKPKAIYSITAFLISILLIINVLFFQIFVLWITVILISVSEILGFSSILTLLSNAVEPNEQGKVMGSLGSIFALAWVFNAISIGLLSNILVQAPLILASFSFFISGTLLLVENASCSNTNIIVEETV